MKISLAALVLMALSSTLASQAADWGPTPTVKPPPPPIVVLMETTQGPITFRLDRQRAPESVRNFLEYVRSGYYEGMIFHRVIPGFMAQGGGVDELFRRKPMRPPIANEADNGLRNGRGTIAMARESLPHSATSEFYINLVDNRKLDYPNPDGWGYTVFGTVESGMDAVDRMATIPTGAGGIFDTDVPLTPIVISKVSVLETAAATPAPVTPAVPAKPESPAETPNP